MSRRLYRSRTDRVIAGVCGGVGHHLGIDAVIIRLAWVVLALAGGAGLVVYVIAAIIIPREPEGAGGGAGAGGSPVEGATTVAALLIGLGVFLLFRTYLPIRILAGWMLPLGLILIGVLLLARDRN